MENFQTRTAPIYSNEKTANKMCKPYFDGNEKHIKEKQPTNEK